MRFPSFTHIAEKTTSTLKRFPLTILSAATAAGLAIYLVEYPPDETTPLFNILLVALLGIPLFTVTELFCEKKRWTAWRAAGVHITGVLLLVVYCFSLPDDIDGAPYTHIYRYILYIIGIHLLVAVGPYWNRGETGAFWEYNKTFLLRFLTAVLFSGVLFTGLSIALLSIDVLLEVSVNEERYMELFIFIGGIFNTWFFLAGIPSMQAFDDRSDYPKGLKIFTQNILIPLVIIYLIILYLYAGKIILQWSWPEGWVANLILSFSIAGIFALLLLHPIQEKVENRWIKRFSTGYFWTLVPLVILLMMAIYRRISEYGITIERYFVIILALWLAGMVIYYLISKIWNIKVIPGSLCVLVFIISFGPWGAFSVSERSQMNRLEHLLQENKILQNGTIQKASTGISFADRKELSSIVRYLNNNHGLDGIQPWFEQDLSKDTTHQFSPDSTAAVNNYKRPEYAMSLMGLEFINRWEANGTQEEKTTHLDFHSNRMGSMNVQGINWIIRDAEWTPDGNTQRYDIDGEHTLVVESQKKEPHVRIFISDNEQESLTFEITPVIEQFRKTHADSSRSIPVDDMTLRSSEGGFSAVLYLKLVSWVSKADSSGLYFARFDIGVK